MFQEIIENIKKEAQRIEEDSCHSAKGHFNTEVRLNKMHYFIGIPMITCSTAAGTAFWGAYPKLAAILSFLAMVLGSIQTFIKLEQKISSHHNSGCAYNALKNKVRIFREIKLPKLELRQAQKRIGTFSDEKINIDSLALPVGSWAYRKAKKDIEARTAEYRIDQQGENK